MAARDVTGVRKDWIYLKMEVGTMHRESFLLIKAHPLRLVRLDMM